MTLKRMDNVLIVVDDLEAANAFFIKLSMDTAAIPNPALKPFDLLVGEWDTVGSHPLLLNTPLHGHTSFAWLEGGAFLIMHLAMDHAEMPNALVFCQQSSALLPTLGILSPPAETNSRPSCRFARQLFVVLGRSKDLNPPNVPGTGQM
jgi:hypothetical protein